MALPLKSKWLPIWKSSITFGFVIVLPFTRHGLEEWPIYLSWNFLWYSSFTLTNLEKLSLACHYISCCAFCNNCIRMTTWNQGFKIKSNEISHKYSTICWLVWYRWPMGKFILHLVWHLTDKRCSAELHQITCGV